MKQYYFLIIIVLLTAISLKAQQPLMPEKIYSFMPIPVQKPVMLDSVNLDKSTFTDELLLAYPISFPPQERFTTELTPDTAGFFILSRPAQGYSYFLSLSPVIATGREN